MVTFSRASQASQPSLAPALTPNPRPSRLALPFPFELAQFQPLIPIEPGGPTGHASSSESEPESELAYEAGAGAEAVKVEEVEACDEPDELSDE